MRTNYVIKFEQTRVRHLPPPTAYVYESSLLGSESKVTSLDDIHKWIPILLSPFIKGLRRRRRRTSSLLTYTCVCVCVLPSVTHQ
jgi:hypothetical protein